MVASSPTTFCARLYRLPLRWLGALFAVELVLLAGLAFWKIPFSYPEGDIALNALDVLRTGHVQSAFLPAIYPFVIAHAYAAAGPAGFVLLQACFYWALMVLVGCAVWLGTRLPRESLVAAAVLVLEPDLLSAIPKALDTLAASVLMLSIVCLCLDILVRRHAPGWRGIVLLGLCWGLALAVRPNMAVMLVPIAYAIFAGRLSSAPMRLAAAVCIALAALAGANALAHGSVYLPQNGPYNFFAGANAFTWQALTHGYNAELSIPAAIAPYWPHGLALPTRPHAYYNPQLNPLYTRLALHFIGAHPLEWLGLAGLKLITLLRPSLRNHHGFGPSALLEVLTSLCVPLWLVLVGLTRRSTRSLTELRGTALRVDRFFYLMAGAYILPFLLTNADPRFRTPLDVVVLTHAAILVIRTWGAVPGSGWQRQ